MSICNQNWFNCCPVNQQGSLLTNILKWSQSHIVLSTAEFLPSAIAAQLFVVQPVSQKAYFTSHKHWSWPVDAKKPMSAVCIFSGPILILILPLEDNIHTHSVSQTRSERTDGLLDCLPEMERGWERERSVLSASVIGRGADTQCMWQGQSGVEGPPCNINSHLEQLWLRAWNIEQNSCHGSTAVLPACTVC